MATTASVPAKSDCSSSPAGQVPCNISFPPCAGVKVKTEPDSDINLDDGNFPHNMGYSDAGMTPKSGTPMTGLTITGTSVLEAQLSCADTNNLVPVKSEYESREQLLPELRLPSQPAKDGAENNKHEPTTNDGETSQSSTCSWNEADAVESTEIATGTSSLARTTRVPEELLMEKNQVEHPESDDDVTQKLSNLQNTCPFCERKFHYPSMLRHHIKIHNAERKFKCAECGAGFKDKTSLKTHMYTHRAVKPFKCSLCPSTQCTNSALQRHIERCHSTDEEQVTCNICGKCCKSRECLLRHLECHAGKNNLCTVCGKLFNKKRLLKYHIARTHEFTTKDVPGIFQCEHCNHVVGDKVTLANHILHVHLQVRQYECLVCNKSFAVKTQLQQHMNCHFQERVTCKCGRSFSNKSSLYRHSLTHKNYRPYTCAMCGLTFTQKSSVERHIITSMEKEHFKRTGTCKPITSGRGGYYAVNDMY